MNSFPVDTAQIVGLFMESVTYGVFVTTFFWCIRVLLYSPTHRFHLKPRHKINYRMLVAAILMFVFASLDVAFGLRRNIDAFITYNDSNKDATGVENAERVFNDIGNWVNVMKFVDYVAQTFIGDCILIYRCYLVWDRTWPIVVPSVFLWLGETVCGCIVAALEGSSKSGGSLNSSAITPFITSMLSLTLATNLLTTFLIVYRLWNVQSRSQMFLRSQRDTGGSRNKGSVRHLARSWNSDPLGRAMRVMVESGLIYTISLVVLFVLYLSSSNAELGVSDSIVQIIGITFNLIIIRTNQTVSHSHSSDLSASHSQDHPRSVPLNTMISIHTVTETELSPTSPAQNKGSLLRPQISYPGPRTRYSYSQQSPTHPEPGLYAGAHPYALPNVLDDMPKNKKEKVNLGVIDDDLEISKGQEDRAKDMELDFGSAMERMRSNKSGHGADYWQAM